MVRLALDNSQYYINRDVSWLAFNERVLEEAEDAGNPLLERLKFLSISASNLDEFFEIRVAAMMQQIEDGYNEAGPDGLTLTARRDALAKLTHDFVDQQYECWNNLRPEMAEKGIRVLSLHELDAEARRFAEEYCARELDPLLTPVTLDPAHPFPRVINKALCLALLLKRRRRGAAINLGVVTVPRVLPRLVKLPKTNGNTDYIFLADVVAAHASTMFRGYDVISDAAFRITRNSNLYLQEEESRNLLDTVRTELHNRRRGDAVRLEVDTGASSEIIERLRTNFELEAWQVYHTEGPVNLSRLFYLYDDAVRPELKFKPFTPREFSISRSSHTIFEELRHRDVLLHHPFDSYQSVVSFLETAAEDPSVLSIKQTLYRTSEKSQIAEALIEAGATKEVTVVVELKARFDEASNIRWARNLEDAGVQVFHGLVGLKTHCKLALLARKDEDGVTRRYAHLGTGNYNPVTSKFYTDLSLLTSDETITSAVHGVFNYLTAYAERPNYEPLLVSPIDLVTRVEELIDREGEHAREGRPARIIAKMNGLLDRKTIKALYRASQDGVKIDLIVRGPCALRPGIKGVSENIQVRSIVGRFLEHSRIFCFHNGGEEEIYLGSADWMPRNLYERVEVVFPLKDKALRARVRDIILASYLADTLKARILGADGKYHPARKLVRGRAATDAFGAQEFLIALAEGKKTPEDIPAEPEPAHARRKTPVKADTTNA